MARILKVFDFVTLDQIGAIEVDLDTGRFTFSGGAQDLEDWVLSDLSSGMRERRGREYGTGARTTYDVGYEVILPADPLFEQFLTLRLMKRNWCEESLRNAVMTHDNFSSHPWRLAHQS